MGISFTVHVSSIKENFNTNDKPSHIVQSLAFQKAQDVSRHYKSAFIMGADTLVVLNNKILGKPTSKQDAEEILLKLSNQTHRVLTGVAIIHTDEDKNIAKKTFFYDQTYVTFVNLSSEMIERYVNTGKPMDKAGSYGIQDKWGAIFVKKINGNYNTVVGLPIHKLYPHLKTLVPKNFND